MMISTATSRAAILTAALALLVSVLPSRARAACAPTTPSTEVCDGLDNDCNGLVDDDLSDAPSPAWDGCWASPGNCCSFRSVNWCPPVGASCSGNGALTAPCASGKLVCANGGWTCQGSKQPTAESCDGLDNDCNGTPDDGSFPEVGATCGSEVGECRGGLLVCRGGLTCDVAVAPAAEVCDGKDNDCDGEADDDLPLGESCKSYDDDAYPGDRSQGSCLPGVYQCEPETGLLCAGGVGPQPESCNGVDDDCDGQVDEAGAAPDGLDGTSDPLAPGTARIGEVCGSSVGSCQEGAFGCLDGAVACLGAVPPQKEACDCADNDCDGDTDEDPSSGSLCAEGGECVKSGAGCQCALPCAGLTGCPSDKACLAVVESSTAVPGNYCIGEAACAGGCETKTVTDAAGEVLCAPAGTPPDAQCFAPPVCVCRADGCVPPCRGVVCDTGMVCAESGAFAGTCVADACPAQPCKGCDQLCQAGQCLRDPCASAPCQPHESCEPTADFLGFACASADADAGVAIADAGDAVDAGAADGPSTEAKGCGCGATSGAASPFTMLLLAALASRARRSSAGRRT